VESILKKPDYRPVGQRWRITGFPAATVRCAFASFNATFLEDKLIVTFNDVTERKRAEEALLASQQSSKGLSTRYDQSILEGQESRLFGL